jgi:hypothetical protein
MGDLNHCGAELCTDNVALMAESQKRGREVQELVEAAFNTLRRSYELIQETEKIGGQSRELMRFFTLRDPSHTQTREPRD